MEQSFSASTAPDAPLVFLDSINRQWDKYSAAVKVARQDLAPEPVRSLRVSGRRLAQMLQLMQALNGQPSLKGALRLLKNQLKALDGLRDTQVVLQEIQEMDAQIPSLQKFRACLLQAQSRMARKVRKGLKDFDPAGVQTPIVRWILSLDPVLTRQFPAAILAEMDGYFQLARRRFDSLEPADPATIHKFRIAFRKFRYLLEGMEGLMPALPPKLPAGLQYYQGLMGAVQDLHILIRSLAEFAAADLAFNPRPALDAYHQCSADAVCVFTDQMGLLDTFWRPNSASPFPWEETG